MGRSTNRFRARICTVRHCWHLLLTCLISLVFTVAEAYAQENASADGIEKQSSGADNAATPDAKPYVDQTISDSTLTPSVLFGDNEDEHYDPKGLPHYFRLDAVSSVSKRSDTNDIHENGISINGQFETQHYGAYSINGVFRNEPSGKAGVILQRRLPFDDGWIANNGLGTLYTPSIDLARNQYRFYIPTFPVFGVSTEWLHQDKVQLQFATGNPGVFDGIQLNGFSQLGGSMTMAGAQWNVSPQWQVGAQMVSTHRVSSTVSGTSFNDFFNLPSSADNTKLSGESFYGTAAWQGEDTRVQANILHSQNNISSNATGIWLDAKKRIGRVSHNAGIFRLDPDLAWGYTPISNDIEGVYYRANYNSRQWLLDGGFDAVKSISGDSANGVLMTGSVRYQVSQALGIGGSATYRNAENDARSGYVFADAANRYGTGRAQLDYSAEDNSKLARITASQNWRLAASSRLNTSIYSEIEHNNNERIHHVGASLNGGSDLFNNVAWNGNLSYDKSNGKSDSSSINANLDLTARLNSNWSFIASYLKTRNKTSNPFFIQPLIQTQSNSEVAKGSALFVTLRYETRGGTSLAPLGGASGSAAGSIAGYLFLDANENGNPDANEEPAQNITVILDGKFSTRTNAVGRFEFPLVATGKHIITVVADNLPLPWLVNESGQQAITVSNRETVYVNIPASRIK